MFIKKVLLSIVPMLLFPCVLSAGDVQPDYDAIYRQANKLQRLQKEAQENVVNVQSNPSSDSLASNERVAKTQSSNGPIYAGAAIIVAIILSVGIYAASKKPSGQPPT